MKLSQLLVLIACSATALAVTQAQAQDDTLKKIKDLNAVTLGYREASIPFSYLDADLKPVGFSMDFCKSIVDRIKKQMKMQELKVEYVAVNSSNRIPLVQNGTVDIECGGTANNPTRQQQVAFSVATFVSQPRWLVRADSGLKTAADLKGKTVVTTQGSNAVGFARQISQASGLDLKIVQAKDHSESMLMLDNGRAVAFLEDDILLAGEKANSRDPAAFALLPDGYETIYYGLVFRRDDPNFKALVDEVLRGMMKSGEFQKIYEKWFQSPIPPRGKNLQFPMSELLKERIRNPSDKAS
jgi:glutamate/aspartate transport system substrate-binding protein